MQPLLVVQIAWEDGPRCQANKKRYCSHDVLTVKALNYRTQIFTHLELCIAVARSRIKPDELYILSFKKGRGRWTRPFLKLSI